jgi:ABC-2 type transport system permease protein
MNVRRRIARAEAVDLVRSGRFRLSAAAIFVLLASGAIAGAWRHADGARGTARLAEGERERWLGQGNKTPHGAAHYGVFVARPARVLAAFDEGVAPYAGTVVHLEPHEQRLFRFRPAEDMTWVRRLGALTAAAALQHLVPFLILFLAYGAVAGERERGTLALLLSCGVHPRDVALGKAAGLALPLAGGLLVLAPLGAYAVLAPNGQAGDAGRVALLAAAYLAFLATWTLLCLAVSARSRSSRAALLALLAHWAGWTVAAPPVAMEVAEAASPAPDPLAFRAGIDKDRYGMVTWYERLAAIEKRLLAEHGKERLDDLPVSAQGVGLVEEEADQDRIMSRHFDALLATHERQSRLFEWAGFFSPVIALQSLSASLAGTHLLDQVDFLRASETYRREFVQILNRDTALNDLPQNRTDLGIPGISEKYYQPGRELWEKVPPLRYAGPSTATAVGRHVPAVLALGVWLAGAAAAVLTLRGQA